ncbi:c-type cytochrome [Kozakia baliensis]|uniref:c-type cytochrome n=1 Tax=Kozakia baliensis TaxID=153496 RepID=UPI000689E030|nr:cytochrome c [Kozakia baliensis]
MTSAFAKYAPLGLGLFFSTLPLAAKAQDAASSSVIEEGRYLAAASDCSACHTIKDGAAYAGGLPFALPIGTIYAPNITPDRQYGIGAYTEAEFSRALRQGIRRDGSALYPAMPYPSYARLSDHDIHALYVYFQNGVHAVPSAPPENKISWPLSMRWPMTVWRHLFAPTPEQARKNAARSFPAAAVARGAYLVEGPAHCGACHTPRAVTMQEKSLSSDQGDTYLAGGASVDGWTPTSLRQDDRIGLGRWNENDIVEFLRSGRNQHGSAFGGMSAAIEHGTQHLSDADLHAIAQYLLTLSPRHKNDAPWIYNEKMALALRHGDASQPGAKIYVDHCAACHRTDGRGYPPTFPPLAGNPVLMSDAVDSLVHIVQSGGALPSMKAAPSAFVMPSFGHMLNDAQIAAVVTFIRKSWGNNASPVTQEQVANLRKSAPAPVLQDPPVPTN